MSTQKNFLVGITRVDRADTFDRILWGYFLGRRVKEPDLSYREVVEDFITAAELWDDFSVEWGTQCIVRMNAHFREASKKT